MLPLLHQILAGRCLQADGCCPYIFLILRELWFLQFGSQLCLGTQCPQYLPVISLKDWENFVAPQWQTGQQCFWILMLYEEHSKFPFHLCGEARGVLSTGHCGAPLELQDQQLPSPAGPGRTDGIKNHTSKVGACGNTKPMLWNMFCTPDSFRERSQMQIRGR